MSDIYTWCVFYHDDTTTPEFDESRPDGRGFAEIGTRQVASIELQSPAQVLPSHRVTIPDGATPIFFRRRTIGIGPMTGPASKTIHCIGWQKPDYASYLFVFEDGSRLLSDKLNAV